METISTFVILDIETTGIPRYEVKPTKIKELTLLAVNRRDIQAYTSGKFPSLNKLSYIFNPERNIKGSSEGLTNRILQNQPIFKNRTQSLISFLEEFPKPVCLVAHNGNSFDFKILQSEFIEAKAELPNDLLCVDSLWAFRKILKNANLSNKPLPAVNSTLNPSTSKNEDKTDVIVSVEENITSGALMKKISISSHQTKCNPKGSPRESDFALGNTDGAPLKNEHITQPDNTSYNLQALYKRLLNKDPVNAHRSEADCVMLLECILTKKYEFLKYANDNCKLLSEVKLFGTKKFSSE